MCEEVSVDGVLRVPVHPATSDPELSKQMLRSGDLCTHCHRRLVGNPFCTPADGHESADVCRVCCENCPHQPHPDDEDAETHPMASSEERPTTAPLLSPQGLARRTKAWLA